MQIYLKKWQFKVLVVILHISVEDPKRIFCFNFVANLNGRSTKRKTQSKSKKPTDSGDKQNKYFFPIPSFAPLDNKLHELSC